ncbi:MAG: FtsQ-type POTRA domain-containing protein [Geminicoccaceae bacterium]|nr:FtsQ-type POTRA domain-containing protein [Geminicoccaceae bacterium]
MLACSTATLAGWWAVSNNLAGQAGSVVLAKAADWTRSMGLEVKEVMAIGRARTKSGDIRDKIANIYGQNILLVDISEVRTQLESLPWVRSASVRRMLPDTLYLELDERRPTAIWEDENGVARLIDEHGEIIPVSDVGIFAHLPVVSGKGARTEVTALFRSLLDEPALVSRISGAQLVDERRWNVFLDGRIAVKLPAHEVGKAWGVLARAERETSLLERAIEAVDLRNPDWLVVRLVDEATGSAAVGRQA